MRKWLPLDRSPVGQIMGVSRDALVLIGLLFAVAAVLAGCATENPIKGSLQGSSCADCHLNKDRILATADPDTTDPGESGEG